MNRVAEIMLCLVFVVCVMAAIPAWALSDIGIYPVKEEAKLDPNSRESLLNSFDKSRFDTTPIEFIVGTVKYRFPRNYLFSFPITKTTTRILRVTYPNFEPLTEKNKECFLDREYVKGKCSFIELDINGPAKFPRDDEAFKNYMRQPWIKNIKLTILPDGVKKYTYNQGDKTNEIYRYCTKQQNIFMTCDSYGNGKPVMCDNDAEPLAEGNSVSYYVHYSFMPEIVQVDKGIISLIKKFTVK